MEGENVQVQFKNWTTDKEWLPKTEDEPLQIFKVNQLGQQQIPSGIPEPVVPDYERKSSLKDMKDNITKLKVYLPFSAYAWWESLFDNPSALLETVNIPWFLNQIQPWQQEVREEPLEQLDISPLALLRQKEKFIEKVNDKLQNCIF